MTSFRALRALSLLWCFSSCAANDAKDPAQTPTDGPAPAPMMSMSCCECIEACSLSGSTVPGGCRGACGSAGYCNGSEACGAPPPPEPCPSMPNMPAMQNCGGTSPLCCLATEKCASDVSGMKVCAKKCSTDTGGICEGEEGATCSTGPDGTWYAAAATLDCPLLGHPTSCWCQEPACSAQHPFGPCADTALECIRCSEGTDQATASCEDPRTFRCPCGPGEPNGACDEGTVCWICDVPPAPNPDEIPGGDGVPSGPGTPNAGGTPECVLDLAGADGQGDGIGDCDCDKDHPNGFCAPSSAYDRLAPNAPPHSDRKCVQCTYPQDPNDKFIGCKPLDYVCNCDVDGLGCYQEDDGSQYGCCEEQLGYSECVMLRGPNTPDVAPGFPQPPPRIQRSCSSCLNHWGDASTDVFCAMSANTAKPECNKRCDEGEPYCLDPDGNGQRECSECRRHLHPAENLICQADHQAEEDPTLWTCRRCDGGDVAEGQPYLHPGTGNLVTLRGSPKKYMCERDPCDCGVKCCRNAQPLLPSAGFPGLDTTFTLPISGIVWLEIAAKDGDTHPPWIGTCEAEKDRVTRLELCLKDGDDFKFVDPQGPGTAVKMCTSLGGASQQQATCRTQVCDASESPYHSCGSPKCDFQKAELTGYRHTYSIEGKLGAWSVLAGNTEAKAAVAGLVAFSGGNGVFEYTGAYAQDNNNVLQPAQCGHPLFRGSREGCCAPDQQDNPIPRVVSKEWKSEGAEIRLSGIVGWGVFGHAFGLTAEYKLCSGMQEFKEFYCSGHSPPFYKQLNARSITVDLPGSPYAVDTGFFQLYVATNSTHILVKAKVKLTGSILGPIYIPRKWESGDDIDETCDFFSKLPSTSPVF